jgi:23S rRNA U2552 (ribose-2'-O)-methylase RlmE/FtsJ
MNVKEQDIITYVHCLSQGSESPPKRISLVKKKYIDFVFQDMYTNMCELKSKIDERDNSKLWDKAKRRVNPYELVNVLGTNILQNEKISKHENYVPLSRAFFKLTEIFLSIDIVPDKYKSTPGVIANIAEGPGGFIEALYKQRTVMGLQDTFYGITLQSKNRNIPGWEQLQRRKKHFLNNKNVILKTGNLYNVKTVLKYSKLFTKQKAWLVTCDGGFDYSNDFNNQETNSRKIIYAEITTTLLIQEKSGSMVCKMFDLFTKFSLQIIYLLTLLYEQVYIVKPLTSRPANSEKYIVATRFKGIQPELSQSMINCLLNWDDINTKKVDNYLKTSIFYPLSNTITDDVKKIVGGLEIENMNLPDNFTERIKTINIFVTNNQKMYITKTLKYIKNFKNTVSDKKFQKKYSELWFNKYNVLNKDKMFKCC